MVNEPGGEDQHGRAGFALEASQEVAQGAFASIRDNPGLLLLSLIISVTLWVFVTESENPTRVDVFSQELPVTAVNVGENFAVANQLQRVEVRISADQDRWDRLTEANFRAVVDLNGLDAREQDVTVRVEVSGISGVRVLGTEPATISVNLEALRSKEVPVEARLRGTLPRGYELLSVAADRATAVVSGPESLVDLVSVAIAEIDVTGLTVGINDPVELQAEPTGGGEIRGVTLRPGVVGVSVDVEQSELTRRLPVEARLTGDPPAGYRVAGIDVSPSIVALTGPIDVLQGLDSLVLPEISVEGLDADFVTVAVLPVPDGARVSGSDSVLVTVQIEALPGSARLRLAPIAIKTAPGLTATIAEATMSVVLEGKQVDIDAAIAAGITAVVDLSGLTAGSYSLPLTIPVPDGVRVVSVQPERVSVTLSGP